MWTDRQEDRQVVINQDSGAAEKENWRSDTKTTERRDGGSQFDRLKEKDRQADRETAAKVDRFAYSETALPGNGRPISHSSTTEFGSVNLYCPRGDN